jgi:hypothetical protein
MKLMKHIVLALVAAFVATVVLYAADLNKALHDTENRRKAAESGLHVIKAKSAADGQAVRATYEEAAVQHNEWIDQVSVSF